jgi:hypothetical protein
VGINRLLAAVIFAVPAIGQEPAVVPITAVPAGDCLASGHTCVRIRNSTAIDFDTFEVRFPDGAEEFGPLPAGAVTAYRRISRSWLYNEVVATAGNRKFAFVIADRIGEPVRPAGIYTFSYRVRLLDEPVKDDDGLLLAGFLVGEYVADENR